MRENRLIHLRPNQVSNRAFSSKDPRSQVQSLRTRDRTLQRKETERRAASQQQSRDASNTVRDLNDKYAGSGSTGNGVVIGVLANAFGDGSNIAASAGTEVTVTDTMQGATPSETMHIATPGAVTIAGSPSAGRLVSIKIRRLPADAGDTAAGDIKIVGILVTYS